MSKKRIGGFIVLAFWVGIPWTFVKSLLHLVEGLWRASLAEWAYMFLDLVGRFLVYHPRNIEQVPFIGIGALLGDIGILVLAIWLIGKGRKKVVQPLQSKLVEEIKL